MGAGGHVLAEAVFLVLWLRLIFWTALAVRFHRTAARFAVPSCDPPPGISVVIPAYNEARQIAPTLRALSAQTLTPSQVFVVDDGSRDETAKIAASGLRDLRGGRLLRLKRNSGKATALNAGIAAADGLLVATVDADTRLAPDALGAAAAELGQAGGDAAALNVVVEAPDTLMRRIQAHEYAGSLNFERASQARLGAIGILPGAATLFRSDVLGEAPFSDRTLTEDADKTLTLLTGGARLLLVPNANALTSAPAGLRGLLRQRARWTAGHLQCAALHWRAHRGANRGARLGVANFVLTALAPVLALLAFSGLLIFGPSPVLGLSWIGALALSSVLAYGQRAIALRVDRGNWQGWLTYILEPPVTSMVHLAGFALGLIRTGRMRLS